MKLSVLDLVPALAGAEPAFALQQAVSLAETAERLGYRRYWAAEHHDLPGLACPAPEVLLAYIGARTSRIRLGSGALLLPHYKPFKVAETFRLLAALCPGRIDLGIGRAPGGSAHVMMALSGNFLENVRRLPDSLQALMQLLTDSYQLDGQAIAARPVPPEPPEVWMLGTNEKSAGYAAEFGTGYVFGQFMSDRNGAEVIEAYRERFRPSSFMHKPTVIAAISVICADTEAEALRLAAVAGPSLQRGQDASPHNRRPGPTAKLLAGDPQQIASDLAELQRLYGTDEFLVVTPAPDYASRLHSYELLSHVFAH